MVFVVVFYFLDFSAIILIFFSVLVFVKMNSCWPPVKKLFFVYSVMKENEACDITLCLDCIDCIFQNTLGYS